MITVFNDSIHLNEEDGKYYINSYFTQERAEAIAILRDTGTKYVFDGLEATSDMIEEIEYGEFTFKVLSGSARLKMHGPITELFLSTYVK